MHNKTVFISGKLYKQAVEFSWIPVYKTIGANPILMDCGIMFFIGVEKSHYKFLTSKGQIVFIANFDLPVLRVINKNEK